MTPELYTILGVGIALAGLMLNGQRTLRQDLLGRMDKLGQEIVGLRGEVAQLRERMAHLEGLMEGLREAITGGVRLPERPHKSVVDIRFFGDSHRTSLILGVVVAAAMPGTLGWFGWKDRSKTVFERVIRGHSSTMRP